MSSPPTPADQIANLAATARELLAAGPPPLPPDVLADVLRLAAASAGSDAARTVKPARAAGGAS